MISHTRLRCGPTPASARPLAISLALGLLCMADPVRAGVVEGTILDAEGGPVAGAVVVACEAESGIPIHAKTLEPFTRLLLEGNVRDEEMLQFLFAVSDAQGRFRFDALRAGRYRLVAQSWRDAEGPIEGILEVNGREIELLGVAKNVRVRSSGVTSGEIRPLGTASVRIDESILSNNANLLVISRSPLNGDPILGFSVWAGPFMRNAIGGYRMPKGENVIHGLPEGEIHFALFVGDNVPGNGAASVTLAAGETHDVSMQIVASWSDAHHSPPPDLQSLVDEILSGDLTSVIHAGIEQELPGFFDRLQRPGASIFTQSAELIPVLEREIRLNDGRVRLFKDLWAAQSYASLQRTVRRRADRGLRAEAQAPASDSTYEEAFVDLYNVLGKDYPVFGLKEIDWEAVGRELLPRATTVSTDREFGLLCLALIARLEDSHAQLLPGSAVLPEIPFPRWDPGLACLVDDRGRPVVYEVTRGSPADAAGVKVGMIVTAIDGVAARTAIERTMNEAGRYIGYSSRRYLRYNAARWFVRQADRGAPVRIETLDAEGGAHAFELEATLGVRYLPRLPVPIAGINDSANVDWTMLDGDIGYLYVRRIREDLIEQLDEAVGELAGARGMIVDVRGNSGGGFDSRRAHLNFALDRVDEEPLRPRFTGPMALLIDARCISAGEGWASWFVARRRARVLGEATAGASSRKRTYTLKNGLYRVRYPVKAYTGFLDRPIERRGLEPDAALMQNAADLAQGRDTVLEAAREYLLSPQP